MLIINQLLQLTIMFQKKGSQYPVFTGINNYFSPGFCPLIAI